MAVAALITWLLTAAGGFVLLGLWIRKGGTKNSKFPPALILGHFALAVIGLVLWIIYVVTDSSGLAWTAFIVLLPVALLGFVMLARWIPTYRATAPAGAGSAAEKHFPAPVVAGHGLLAVVTVVLVLLTALGVGE